MHKLFDIAYATHVGIKRQGKKNQDSVKVITPGIFHLKNPCLIVADGMGGYNGGELASKIVVDSFSKIYYASCNKSQPREILKESVHLAHQKIRKIGQSKEKLSRMGSTVVAAILDVQNIYLINVGDSRLYIFRNKQVRKLTYDQSVVAELVRHGEITEEEAYHHPKRNLLTMSIGASREKMIPFYFEQKLEFDDVILLCSDGLWGVVPEKLIRTIACQMEPRLAVKELVELANNYGGPDNISVIIARRTGSKLEEEGDEIGEN